MTDIANNSSTTAEVDDGVYHGQIETFGDSDWIAVELTAGVTYSIKGLGAGTDNGTLLDVRVQGIYNSSSVSQSFDSVEQFIEGEDRQAAGFGTTQAYTYFTPSTSGTYYIDIDAWGGGPGSFTLYVTEDQTGGDGNDNLTGGSGADSILGGYGDDVISGGAGNDHLDGEWGDDELTGGAGADKFTFYSDNWDDVHDGVANLWGNDTITDFDPSQDMIHFSGTLVRSGERDITITEVNGNTVIEAFWGDSVTLIGVTPDQLSDDNFQYRLGVQLMGGNIEGDASNNSLTGTSANDTIYGYEGNDTIVGGNGENYLRGFEGDDLITGGNGLDIIGGEEGNDTINAGAGDDYILSNAGNDSVNGDNGNDLIETDLGNDTLNGGNGNDILRPGRGDDQMSGGAGSDEFVIGREWGNDTISDFDLDNDILDFRGTGLEVSDLTISNSGGNAVISDGTNTLTLTGVSSSDLSAVADDVIWGAGNITSHYSEFSEVETIGASDEDILVITDILETDGVRWVQSDDGMTYTSYSFLNYNSIAVSDDNSTWWYDAIEPLTPLAQYTVEQEIARVESYTNLDLVWVEDYGESGANIRMGYHMFVIGGGSTTPYAGPYASDVFIGIGVGEHYREGFFNHELGHSLGFVDLAVWNEFTGQDYTVMSYVVSARQPDAEYGTTGVDYQYADIAGLQYLYGTDNESTAGNDTFTYDISSDEPFIKTIFDAGGTDTIQVTGTGDPVHIDLTPGSWSNIGEDAQYEWWDEASQEVIRASEVGTLFIMPNTTIERAIGSDGDDTLTGNDADNVLRGNDGNDYSDGGNGNDALWAGSDDTGNDTLIGGNGNDTIGGGAGNDSIDGGAGNDLMFGGDGDDIVNTGNGANTIWAGSGDDQITGGDGNDIMGGGLGDDDISGGAGNDVIYGGQDTETAGTNDTLSGGGGNDVIYAAGGNDSVTGGDGNDNLFSGGDNDTVEGGAGNDTLWGGGGDDSFTGGAGADVFYFGGSSGNDTVTDFDTDEDILDLSEAVTNFASTADVEAAASDTANGLLIDLGDGNSVLLEGLATSDISSMDITL